MKKISKLFIGLTLVLVCLFTFCIGVSAENPDMSAFERRHMYDPDAPASVNDGNAWIHWFPPVGGKVASTFTVEPGELLHGISLDCLAVHDAMFELRIYSFPAGADMFWEDDPQELVDAYKAVLNEKPVFEALEQLSQYPNPEFQEQSETNPWGITYGIKTYKFDEPLPAGTYIYTFTMGSENIGPVQTFSFSDYTGLALVERPDGHIERMSSPIALRASYYVTAPFKEYNKVVSEANGLNPDDYEDFSAVTAALAVDMSNVTDQAQIDAQTAAIRAAIDGLVKKEVPATAAPTEEPTTPTKAPEKDDADVDDNKDEKAESKPIWIIPVVIGAVVVICVVIMIIIKKKR